MNDVIVTGASRGIGAALTRSLAAPGARLFLTARAGAALDAAAADVRARGAVAEVLPADLSSLDEARRLGADLAARVEPGATLVHNAGCWPTARALADGLEVSFVVNHLAGLLLQASLLEAHRLARIMVVSAGLIGKGSFDPARTPTGADFSRFRTYCTTKLCFAIASREVASHHPEVDVVVLHPGVVNTDLGATQGLLGWLLTRVKRRWEAPETCAARLTRVLGEPRWSPPGEATWRVLDQPASWPAAANDPATRAAVRASAAALTRDRS